jgi:beta-galactosidase
MARNSMAHLARGADAILFFQWRASRFGAEKFHSAMIPHAGVQTRVFREVTALGADLGRLEEIRGSRVVADVALLWDFESFWAQDLEWRPSIDVSHAERIRAYYERLLRDGITTDFALPGHDLSRYRLVIVPAQYMLSAADAARLTRYVEAGGTLVVSFFSAVVDEHDAVHEGGYLAPLGDALGVTVEEFLPLREGATSSLDWRGAQVLSADVWQEHLVLRGAEPVATYIDGPAAGGAAITRHTHGAGTGWYVSTRPDAEGLAAVMRSVYVDAGIHPPRHPAGVEVVTRHGERADYVVAVNHGATSAVLSVAGIDLLTGEDTGGSLEIAAGGVAVIRT